MLTMETATCGQPTPEGVDLQNQQVGEVVRENPFFRQIGLTAVNALRNFGQLMYDQKPAH